MAFSLWLIMVKDEMMLNDGHDGWPPSMVMNGCQFMFDDEIKD